jgi:hypothetical protein
MAEVNYRDRTPIEAPAGWEDEEGIEFRGPCCSCRRDGVRLRNVVCMGFRAPVSAAGKGWGCVVCGLSSDGAIAVVCDPCREASAPILDVCSGYPTQAGRVEVGALRDRPWAHDRSRHEGDESDG